jgi:peptide/nickel transport system substrate-binding protein
MGKDSDLTRRDVFALAAFGLAAGPSRRAFAAAPSGQLTWGIHVSLAPAWFDPAETQALITPFMVLYALHDAMVKPMPDSSQAPCLAESWSASEDGLSYEFALRRGTKFHNGEPVTAEDVRFSFERYRGACADARPGGCNRNTRSAAPALQAKKALARLSELQF